MVSSSCLSHVQGHTPCLNNLASITIWDLTVVRIQPSTKFPVTCSDGG